MIKKEIKQTTVDTRILYNPTLDDLKTHMEKIGVDPKGINLMVPKGKLLCIKIYDLESKWCNILKQEMLSIGGDLAVSKEVTYKNADKSDCLLIGTLKHIQLLEKKLELQPLYLNKIKDVLSKTVDNFNQNSYTLKLQDREISIKPYDPLIMGVLNLTPDSFSNDGVYKNSDIDTNEIIKKAVKIQQDGADILDMGAESSRPGSDPVSVSEELNRIKPVLKQIVKELDIPISIDTYKSKVAEYAFDNGAAILNDISGLNADRNMSAILSKYKPAVVIMHMQGTPKTMQSEPDYKDLMREISDYFRKSIDIALQSGLEDKNIILDPGIGFGKTVEHNLYIIRNLEEFKSLGYPLMIGLSRKSFIGKVLGTDVSDRLFGTIASIAIAIKNKVNIVRVHDVKQVKQACEISRAILQQALD